MKRRLLLLLVFDAQERHLIVIHRHSYSPNPPVCLRARLGPLSFELKKRGIPAEFEKKRIPAGKFEGKREEKEMEKRGRREGIWGPP